MEPRKLRWQLQEEYLERFAQSIACRRLVSLAFGIHLDPLVFVLSSSSSVASSTTAAAASTCSRRHYRGGIDGKAYRV
jgi:hypothetical protein